MVYKWFEVKDGLGFVYSYKDLLELKWVGDNKMELFRSTWELIVNGLEEKLSETHLRDILRDKLADSNVLKADIAHFDRQGKAHQDKTLAFLIGCIDRHIDLQQTERNKVARLASIQKEMKKHRAVPAQPKNDKGKGKGKGKGKQKGNIPRAPSPYKGLSLIHI